MSISFSQDTSLECPECQVMFSTDAWVLVDASERPDLAERCRDGSIFNVTCPNGHTGTLSGPLLFHDSQTQKLVFSIPPGVDDPAAREVHQQLMSRLTAELETPYPDYYNQTQVVPQQFLRVALAADPAAAFREAQQDAAHLTTVEERGLADTLQQFVQEKTWDESQRILETHPELLTDDADTVLGKLIDAASEANDENGRGILANHRELLQSVRREGADAAFAKVRFSAADGAPTLPPEIIARLQEMNIRTEQEFERAMVEHPDLAEAVRNATMAGNPALAAIQMLSRAQSPRDVLHMARDYPVLLEDATLQQIQTLSSTSRGQGEEGMAQHLDRCLQTLAEFKQSGMSLDQIDSLEQQMQNPETVALMQELAQQGIQSQEQLDALLAERPRSARTDGTRRGRIRSKCQCRCRCRWSCTRRAKRCRRRGTCDRRARRFLHRGPCARRVNQRAGCCEPAVMKRYDLATAGVEVTESPLRRPPACRGRVLRSRLGARAKAEHIALSLQPE